MELVNLRRFPAVAGIKVKHSPAIAKVFDLNRVFKRRIKVLVVTHSSSGGFGEVQDSTSATS
jgi:hypothetical protein